MAGQRLVVSRLRPHPGVTGDTGHEYQHGQHGQGDDTREIRIRLHWRGFGENGNSEHGNSGGLRALGGDEQDQQSENEDGDKHAVSIPR
jgi:hypothetical protein